MAVDGQAVVVAFGDSVTLGVREGVLPEQTYSALLEQRLNADQVPARVINSGVGGLTTEQGRDLFEPTVLAHRPDLTLLMFGLNDSAMADGEGLPRTEPRVLLDRYVYNLTEFIGGLRAAGSRVVLCSSNPLTRRHALADTGIYATGDMNAELVRFVGACASLAGETGVPFVDIYQPFFDTPGALDTLTDGVHPNPEGHALIAGWLYDTVRAELTR